MLKLGSLGWRFCSILKQLITNPLWPHFFGSGRPGPGPGAPLEADSAFRFGLLLLEVEKCRLHLLLALLHIIYSLFMRVARTDTYKVQLQQRRKGWWANAVGFGDLRVMGRESM